MNDLPSDCTKVTLGSGIVQNSIKGDDMTNLSSRNLQTMILLSAGTIIVLACAATSPATTPTLPAVPTATTAPLFQQITLTPTSSEDDGQSPAYKITTQTPSLAGSDDARVKAFNAEMTALVTKAVADFKKNMADMNVPSVSAESSFDVRYKLLSPPGNLFSLKFEMEGYVSGMAHPYHLSETVNYNLQQGTDISIADLFLLDSTYLQTIATYCAAQLKTRDIGFQDDFTRELTRRPIITTTGTLPPTACLSPSMNTRWRLMYSAHRP